MAKKKVKKVDKTTAEATIKHTQPRPESSKQTKQKGNKKENAIKPTGHN